MPLCSLKLLLQLRPPPAAVSTETFLRLKLRPRLSPCSSCPEGPTCKSPSKCRRFSPTVSPSCGPFLPTEKTVFQPHLDLDQLSFTFKTFIIPGNLVLLSYRQIVGERHCFSGLAKRLLGTDSVLALRSLLAKSYHYSKGT